MIGKRHSPEGGKHPALELQLFGQNKGSAVPPLSSLKPNNPSILYIKNQTASLVQTLGY